jgi:glycosyltransferase involved in cell wall biosynthesis
VKGVGGDREGEYLDGKFQYRSPKMEVSLIITTYNWPQALKLTLKSVLAQSTLPDELIVADDGSGSETEQAVEKTMRPSHLKWVHVRHHDAGIRQARIKNLGARYASGSYFIFIDHDVVLHPDFILDHVAAAEKSVFLQGKRSFLPEGFTSRVLNNGKFNLPSPFLRGLENKKNAVRCTALGKLLSRPKGYQKNLRGCNFSLHREDFLKVDGYDETFDQLWGREDSDICYRLFHCGVKIKNLWFAAVQYHLYHEVIKKRGKDSLDLELLENLKQKRKRALKGFSKLSSEGELVASSVR